LLGDFFAFHSSSYWLIFRTKKQNLCREASDTSRIAAENALAQSTAELSKSKAFQADSEALALVQSQLEAAQANNQALLRTIEETSSQQQLVNELESIVAAVKSDLARLQAVEEEERTELERVRFVVFTLKKEKLDQGIDVRG